MPSPRSCQQSGPIGQRSPLSGKELVLRRYPRRRSTDRSAARDARGNVISTTASAILHCYDQKGRRVKRTSSHHSIHVRVRLILRPTDPMEKVLFKGAKVGFQLDGNDWLARWPQQLRVSNIRRSGGRRARVF